MIIYVIIENNEIGIPGGEDLIVNTYKSKEAALAAMDKLHDKYSDIIDNKHQLGIQGRDYEEYEYVENYIYFHYKEDFYQANLYKTIVND